MNYLAQRKIPLGGEPLRGLGTLSDFSSSGDPPLTIFSKILTSIIGLLTIIAGIWFVFLLFSGAIGIMTAGGDKTSLETARKRITSGVIGLVIVVAAIFIADFIGSIIGLDILNPALLFFNITN